MHAVGQESNELLSWKTARQSEDLGLCLTFVRALGKHRLEMK